MAFTYSVVGRVDENPLEGATGQPTALKTVVAKITIGATTDYTVGTGLVLAPSSLGLNSIVYATGTITTTAGVARNLIGYWDSAGASLRFAEIVATTGAGAFTTAEEIEQADITAGDILVGLFIGT